MLQKVQGLLMMFSHDPRQSLIEKMVTVLLGLATANLCVVFLVQGGYEFSVGPILVHARYVPKSLLLHGAVSSRDVRSRVFGKLPARR